jgi:hypothetical protein
MADGVHGEVAYGTTANFLSLHGGPHEVLLDKTGLLDGVIFPVLLRAERPTSSEQ